jgi:hypothetical protein
LVASTLIVYSRLDKDSSDERIFQAEKKAAIIMKITRNVLSVHFRATAACGESLLEAGVTLVNRLYPGSAETELTDKLGLSASFCEIPMR